jgi:hypothetical protein
MKNYTIPARPTPPKVQEKSALPKRRPTYRYHGSLEATKTFGYTISAMHRWCNRELTRHEAAYQEACQALGLTPRPREEVIHLTDMERSNRDLLTRDQ